MSIIEKLEKSVDLIMEAYKEIDIESNIDVCASLEKVVSEIEFCLDELER